MGYCNSCTSRLDALLQECFCIVMYSGVVIVVVSIFIWWSISVLSQKCTVCRSVFCSIINWYDMIWCTCIIYKFCHVFQVLWRVGLWRMTLRMSIISRCVDRRFLTFWCTSLKLLVLYLARQRYWGKISVSRMLQF